MHYQILRNGQMYGPYTLEDLRRYLASGNVLLTDMAKSDTMTEWVQVAQLLGTQPPPAEPVGAAQTGYPLGGAYANPAAGASYVDPVYNPAAGVAVGQYQDPPNLHWGLYLLFTILTGGLFSKVFTVLQAVWLKKVQPNSNGLIFYIALYVLLVITWFRGASVWAVMLAHPGMFPSGRNVGGGVLSIVYLVLLIVTRFVMSASLEEHFNGPEPIGLRLNPLLVFLFGGIYFQYQFNRINALKQAARYGVGRVF
jgi:hypothetical protein